MARDRSTFRPSALERRVVAIVAAVQFVNVLDFVIVMPLGPDFATGLGIATSQVGLVGGSYALSAAITGVIGATFLDRFDRRTSLAVAMAGLVLATAAAGFATGLGTLITARILAGAFGGPATSIAIAAVADTVPIERRGRAMAAVMAAFSIASVIGVPAALQLGAWFGWRMPFFAVAALGGLVTTMAILLMPQMTGHRASAPAAQGPAAPGPRNAAAEAAARNPFADRLARLSLTSTFLTMVGLFAIVPNISTFVQLNRGYPREHLGWLYFLGGIASFLTMNLVGRLIDRFGVTRLVVFGTLLHVTALWIGFISAEPTIPVLGFFVCYMLSGSVRMVPNSSLATRVPLPRFRARFLSAQSAVQHTGSALGALVGSLVLVAGPSGTLEHMRELAIFALIVALCVPLLTAQIEAGVLRRERSEDGAG